jgi:3-oxoacyl-[acyl-carrier protein] reductase
VARSSSGSARWTSWWRTRAAARANCIAPETIETERTGALIPAERKESLIATHPVRRLGTPADVASAAVFLASEEAAWISGVVLDVAGGSVLV